MQYGVIFINCITGGIYMSYGFKRKKQAEQELKRVVSSGGRLIEAPTMEELIKLGEETARSLPQENTGFLQTMCGLAAIESDVMHKRNTLSEEQ